MSHSPLANLQKRFFAWGMARANTGTRSVKLDACHTHDNLGELKQTLFGRVHGTVLEIGPGAGANFAHFPPDIRWIGIEPNPHMHGYLKEEADRRGFGAIALYEGGAERIPLDDASVDCVVGTHVFCSVDDPQQSLREIWRVLKPGGELIFLEHVAAESGSWNRQVQDAVAPIWKRVFDNCHPNRETETALRTAGFEIAEGLNFRLKFPIIAPHAAGVAKKAGVGCGV
ncbi:class I SAM-dependent methyltransferase [Lyngbya sp. CCY1209]|jgi:ubiquinone/menaquinone biosynthesis C-methylase UbiE|uniref:class I SAM-dependent methyltransferase n=1 Tax=Lyngbya sp. CCY1209 TaxID=2886103 RepID=UPI002D201AB6|nr:class I SAM-dependent methyltransferase [Lyngbya sp. CCY1209]MEB3882741.1 class I SAM-dependent methyltransferase [Lyngbya sp. CCY1209]